ncbi:TauD Probable taurine catabolism dioxygenase [Burkholderiaceae bacterium]|jgi:taurine dioxygenase
MPILIRTLNASLSAEISGLDITAELSSETIAALHAAWSHHLVLVFRDQPLTPEQQIRFSRYFGDLDDHRSIPKFRHVDHPEILMVNNREAATNKKLSVGRQWHSDLSTTITPAKGSLLHAIQLPNVGGDTMFCNMYRAWDDLSPRLQTWLSGADALHDMTLAQETRKQRTPAELDDIRKRNPPVFQPICRVHEVTGKKALYVSEMTTSRIDGLTEEESLPILEYLFKQSTAPENVYRHIWRKGDSILWDNRCVMHIALADYDESEIRTMHRTTLRGAPSGRLST